MKETPLSLNSRQFITSVLHEGLRPDARGAYDYRSIDVTYGAQWGHVEVSGQLYTNYCGVLEC